MINKTLITQLIVAIMSLSVKPLIAQSPKIDSLENVLALYKEQDTILVNLLNEISYSYHPSKPQKVRYYAQQAGDLASRLKYEKGKSESLWLKGISMIQSNPDSALYNFQNALNIAQAIDYKVGIVKYITATGTIYGIKGQDSIAINKYNEAINYATINNLHKETGKIFVNLGQSYSRKGKYEEAILNYNKALLILNRYNEIAISATCYNYLGNIYSIQGNYSLALEKYHKGLHLLDSIEDKRGVSLSLISMAGIYFSQQDNDKALEYNLKALEIFEQLDDKHSTAAALLNIGSIYIRTNNPHAMEYLQRALSYSENLNINRLKIYVLLEIGVYYSKLGNYDKALDNFKNALQTSEATGIKSSTSKSAYQIGLIYFKKKQYTQALKYVQRGIVLANEMKLIDDRKDLYQLQSQIYSATQNFQQAYNSYLIYKELSDSINKKENVRNIIELEYTYKFEKAKQVIELEQQKKEAVQLVERKQQKTIIVSLIIGLFLISAITILTYRSYIEKKRTNIKLTKQKREIEELNEEYYALNEMLLAANEQLQNAKETIEERENLLSQITDTVPTTISLINSNMDYDFVNSRYALFYNKTKEDFNCKNVSLVHNDDTFDKDYQSIKHAMGGHNLSFEKSITGANNEQYHYYITLKPYYYHNSSKGVLICGFDITERKKAEQALREIEEEKKRLMEIEMDRIAMELETNQKSMAAATLKLIQNAERDAKTIDQLNIIERYTNIEGKQILRHLLSDYKLISHSTNWSEFELLFEKVHGTFYQKLNTNYPGLTANERKMCAFIKLNMSNKDIAQITFQSNEALKKARLRLRQKLGIDRETNLTSFIQTI